MPDGRLEAPQEADQQDGEEGGHQRVAQGRQDVAGWLGQPELGELLEVEGRDRVAGPDDGLVALDGDLDRVDTGRVPPGGAASVASALNARLAAMCAAARSPAISRSSGARSTLTASRVACRASARRSSRTSPACAWSRTRRPSAAMAVHRGVGSRPGGSTCDARREGAAGLEPGLRLGGRQVAGVPLGQHRSGCRSPPHRSSASWLRTDLGLRPDLDVDPGHRRLGCRPGRPRSRRWRRTSPLRGARMSSVATSPDVARHRVRAPGRPPGPRTGRRRRAHDRRQPRRRGAGHGPVARREGPRDEHGAGMLPRRRLG